MSAALLASPAAEFAVAVRAALSDLTPDEIDDLTDGLEADLADRLADADAADLGDPVAYAEELRTAAGLPHRTTARGGAATIRQSLAAVLHDGPRDVAAAFREFGAAHPSLGRIREFVVTLRPLWWVFRAAVVTAFVVNVIQPGWWSPINGVTVVVGIVALVVSAQFGRGKWLPFAWMRGLLLALNVILVVASPFLVAAVATSINNASYSQDYADSYPDPSRSGLVANGTPVTNIFAYDAQGNPLSDVQLYDQDGRPLSLQSGDGAGFISVGDGSTVLVPSDEVGGRPGWNVVPLQQTDQSAIGDNSVKDSAIRTPAEAPFATVKPLATHEVGPSATPTPAPSSTPAP